MPAGFGAVPDDKPKTFMDSHVMLLRAEISFLIVVESLNLVQLCVMNSGLWVEILFVGGTTHQASKQDALKRRNSSFISISLCQPNSTTKNPHCSRGRAFAKRLMIASLHCSIVPCALQVLFICFSLLLSALAASFCSAQAWKHCLEIVAL